MAQPFSVGSSDPVGTLSDDPTNTDSVAGPPLSVGERAAMVEALMANLGLTRAQAHRFIDSIPSQQARTLLGLLDGSDSITREEAVAMWDLTPDEADILFPQGRPLSTFTNPFGHAFLMFLMLTYSLELDLKQILSEVLQVQKDEAIAKAEDIFKGAIVQFAAAMCAAIITGAFAGMSMYRAKNLMSDKAGSDAQPPAGDSTKKAKKGAQNADGQSQGSSGSNASTADHTKAATDGMWFGPIGASLINQPITAAGEFGNAWYQREGMYHEANVEEARGIFQQLMSVLDTTGQLGRTASQGL